MSKLIKVKILKYVSQYKPGDEIEVSQEVAEQLCGVRKVWDGEKEVEHCVAMLSSDIQKLKETPVELSKLSAYELSQLGVKNIVQTPKDIIEKIEQQAKPIPKSEATETVEETEAEVADQEEDEAINPATQKPYTKKELAAIKKAQESQQG